PARTRKPRTRRLKLLAPSVRPPGHCSRGRSMTTSDTPRVIGLDLSLTSSGVASSLGWTDTIRPKKIRGLERLRMILESVRAYTSGYDLVVLEGPSFGHSGFRQHEELVALRGMSRDVVARQQVTFAIGQTGDMSAV